MNSIEPYKIKDIVFDVNSIVHDFSAETWEIFEKILLILVNRDYRVIFVFENDIPFDSQTVSKISCVSGKTDEIIDQNQSLLSENIFWITDDIEIQNKFEIKKVLFGSQNSSNNPYQALQIDFLQDILFAFDPSRITANILSEEIIEIKRNAPQTPLTIGVAGPDECGHSYFIESLVESLEDREILLSCVDLTDVMGSEFSAEPGNDSLWRSSQIRNWIFNEIFIPYEKGSPVCIEEEPDFIRQFETSNFPFFLAPEMVLIVWGTSLFVPEFDFIGKKILLDLSERTATARVYGIDDRENFDPKFLETYSNHEGKIYENYMKKNDVKNIVNHTIDYNNYNAFKLKI